MDLNNIFDNPPSVYRGSEPSIRSEVDLLSLPPTDLTTDFAPEYITAYPISLQEDYSPLDITIRMDSNGYFDPQESYLELHAKIIKADGTACVVSDANQNAAPCNLFFHSVFSNVEVYINGQLVSDSSNLYHYIAYMQRFLSTTRNEKDTFLKNEFYYPNQAEDLFTTSDDGWNARFKLTSGSHEFTMQGNIVANIFTQPRYFPAGTEIRLVMRRNKPEICIDAPKDKIDGITGTPFKYKITKAVFYACKKVLSSRVVDMHRKALENGDTLKYPIQERNMRMFAIPKDSTSFTSDTMMFAKTPRFLVLGMVSNKAFLGDLKKDAFWFQHFNLSDLSVTWNGGAVGVRHMKFDFIKGTPPTGIDDYLAGVSSLNKVAKNPQLGNGISRDRYTEGNVMIAVELLPRAGDALPINVPGQVQLSLKFSEAVPGNLNLLVLSQHQSVLTIDRNMHVGQLD